MLFDYRTLPLKHVVEARHERAQGCWLTGIIRGVVSALVVMMLFAISGANAQSGLTAEAIEKNRAANLECFACHAEAALKHPPKAGLDLQKLRMFVVDPDVFKDSDHGRLACTKCHNEGYDAFPHAADAKDSTSICEDCHSKKVSQIQPEFEKSVHAKHMGDTFTCMNCHNPHLMRLASKLGDAGKIVAQDNRVCLGCHDSDETFAKFAPEKKARPLIDEIHSWLPNTRLHWQSVRCVECHTPLSTTGMLSHEILDKTKAERKCVTCHTVNSQLNLRLYRSLVDEEQHTLGFVNSVMLSQSYVIGATRNPKLDAIVIALAAVTLLGVLLHGLLRYITARRRRRNQNE